MGILVKLAEIPLEYVIGTASVAQAALSIFLLVRSHRLAIDNANLRMLLEGLRIERTVAISGLQRKFDESTPVALTVVK